MLIYQFNICICIRISMSKVISSFMFGLATKMSSICKISFIFGSHMAYFSMSSIITPLSGAFLGISGGFLVLLTRLVIHAVGSVIWLYTTPTTVEMWLGLIPVVALERCLFALGMVVMYRVIVFIQNKASICVRKTAIVVSQN